ncbi:hypothetical protein JZO70_13475 [Enterococcus sp. 669A]|uniref:Zinc ribbon domain-containing protein n=1 Tax=Candidatus Enterococcus moelleringii TaxID=2815325 RepID=A0ABS3LC22_9ENTE|nr:hypothetical protein [Enterococcus sp. 669A]MBO1307182.1 hypothetical protein [Enterococcus sp. 669A]
MLKSILFLFAANESWQFWGNVAKLLIILLCMVVIVVITWRKNNNTFCKTCQRRVKKFNKYCDYCGTEMTANNKAVIIGINKKHKITSAIAICVLSGALVFSVFQAINRFEFSDYATGMYSGYEQIYTNDDDTWRIECKKALSKGSFHQTIRMKKDSAKTLYIDAKSSFGTLILNVTQADKTEQVDISNTNGPFELDLSEFDTSSEINLDVQHTKVEDVHFTISCGS